MINTFYGMDTLGSTGASYAALLIGFMFGLALERAGFGSSRRLSGVFYFTDMAVIQVMFTALVTAMLGLSLAQGLGLIDPATQIYLMPTYYGTYILAGLIFGVGFVMGGWCPGTAMVGMASGKIDALLFLSGGILGSILYSEIYPIIQPISQWGLSAQGALGQEGLAFIYDTLGISRSGFILAMTAAALIVFWGIERIHDRSGVEKEKKDLPAALWIKQGLAALAVLIWLAPEPGGHSGVTASAGSHLDHFLTAVDAAEDHMEPEILADLLLRSEPGVTVVDVRSRPEYETFHIRGALHAPLASLPEFAVAHASDSKIVLYSNGMTHPVQARDALYRAGHQNFYILTDGLTGFIDRCLKPVSLRREPIAPEEAARINSWRDYFYGVEPEKPGDAAVAENMAFPGLIQTEWLAENLGRTGLRVIDCRDQSEYNRGHIAGSAAISCESFRGVVDGLPSMLQPASELALKLSLLNIVPEDIVVIVYGGDRIRDATLIGLAFERMGHQQYAILDGGLDKWVLEKRALATDLPAGGSSRYPLPLKPDTFTLNGRQMEHFSRTQSAVILDVRPPDYFFGRKSDEARAGHIPGAQNREYSLDIDKKAEYATFKSRGELRKAYQAFIPDPGQTLAVHCRTGHQASQTYFVLRHLLGYKKVFWYDAGWTEWAARKELPVVSGTSKS